MSIIDNNHSSLLIRPADPPQALPSVPEPFQLLAQEKIFSFPELRTFATTQLDSFYSDVKIQKLEKLRPYYAHVLALALQNEGGTEAAIAKVLKRIPEAKVYMVLEAESAYLEDQLLPHLDDVFGQKVNRGQQLRRGYVNTIMDRIQVSRGGEYSLADDAIQDAINLIRQQSGIAENIIQEVNWSYEFEQVQLRVAQTLIEQSAPPFIPGEEIQAISYYLRETWQYNADQAGQSLLKYLQQITHQSVRNDALIEVAYRISPEGLLDEEEYIEEAFEEGIEPVIGDHQKLGVIKNLLRNGAVPDDRSLNIVIELAALSDLTPEIVALMLQRNPDLDIDAALNSIAPTWAETYERANILHEERNMPFARTVYTQQMHLLSITQQLLNAGAKIDSEIADTFESIFLFAALLPGMDAQPADTAPIYQQLIRQGVSINPAVITRLINHPNLQNISANYQVIKELVQTRQLAVPDSALDAIIDKAGDPRRMPLTTVKLFLQEGFRFKDAHLQSLIEQTTGDQIVGAILSTDNIETLNLDTALQQTLQRWQTLSTFSGDASLDDRINNERQPQRQVIYRIAAHLINSGAVISAGGHQLIAQMQQLATENNDADYVDQLNPDRINTSAQSTQSSSAAEIDYGIEPDSPDLNDEDSISSVLSDFPDSPGSFEAGKITGINAPPLPTGLIDTGTDAQSAHDGAGNNGNNTLTAVAGDTPEPEPPFKVINGRVDVSGVLLRALDLSHGTAQPGETLLDIPVGLPEATALPETESTQSNIPVADTRSETQATSPQEGGVTWGGELGSPSEVEKARQQMDDLFGKGWSQGLHKDEFPKIDPKSLRVPGFGEGLEQPDLNSYNTGWGLPDIKIEPTTESFPENDPLLDNILKPNGPAGPDFIFPPGTERDHLPEIPEGVQQALIKALPELQKISYMQFSQLSPADQQQILNRTLEYQQLSPNDKSNINLIDYLDSSKTSDAQRQQLSQLDGQQSVHQTRLNGIAARTGLTENTVALINSRIKALQANIGQLNQHTQDLQQNNAQRLITLSAQAKTDPISAAFIEIEPTSQSPTTERTQAVNTAIHQNTAIPRFMVIRTTNGPKLMENLPNGKTQMHSLPLAADTPVTRQLTDGHWSGVPDVGQIGGKLFLDLLFTQGALKMLNNGGAIQAPQTPNNAPSQPTPETIPQSSF